MVGNLKDRLTGNAAQFISMFLQTMVERIWERAVGRPVSVQTLVPDVLGLSVCVCQATTAEGDDVP